MRATINGPVLIGAYREGNERKTPGPNGETHYRGSVVLLDQEKGNLRTYPIDGACEQLPVGSIAKGIDVILFERAAYRQKSNGDYYGVRMTDPLVVGLKAA